MSAPERKPRFSQSPKASEKRWDKAVDRVLNSGLMCSYMDDFWAYVDGEISWAQFNDRMSP